MSEISLEEDLRAAKVFRYCGVFDNMIDTYRALPSICNVHERLKNAYVDRIIAQNKAVESGDLPRVRALNQELEKIGYFVFNPVRKKDELADSLDTLGDLMTIYAGLSFTQAKRVLEKATTSHRGPDSPYSMPREDMLRAWQMHEDRVPWKKITNEFIGPGGDPNTMAKRLEPLKRVVKKYCPLETGNK